MKQNVIKMGRSRVAPSVRLTSSYLGLCFLPSHMSRLIHFLQVLYPFFQYMVYKYLTFTLLNASIQCYYLKLSIFLKNMEYELHAKTV